MQLEFAAGTVLDDAARATPSIVTTGFGLPATIAGVASNFHESVWDR